MKEAPLIRSRAMHIADLDKVVEIDQAAYPYPWSRGVFTDCLRVGYSCDLYWADEQLIGYTVVSTAVGEASILNICVVPDSQRQGFGREILHRVLAKARLDQVETVFLEVRVSNEAAKNLYLSEGFNEVGQRVDYYPAGGAREDGLVFAKSLL